MNIITPPFLLISIGAVFMLLAVLKTRKLLELLKPRPGKDLRVWKILSFLIIFFFVGYVASLIFISIGLTSILILLTGFVFLFGAIFVYIILRAGLKTINDLIVKDKTEQLNKKLEANVKQLQGAYNDLESFSYSVSHDLRAPLRRIHTMATFIESQYGSSLDEEGKEYLHLMLHNTKKMDQVINDLLEYSQIAKQPINKQPINMELLTKAIVDNIRAEIPDYYAEVKLNPLLKAEADQKMITEVLLNLVTNAFKYSGKKENPIIEINSYAKNGDHIYYVRDNGAGFDMKYAHKLFKVFQRLHFEEDFEGTGIGLAIVARIVERHGGRVWAEGKENEGATFYFSLPKDQH